MHGSVIVERDHGITFACFVCARVYVQNVSTLRRERMCGASVIGNSRTRLKATSTHSTLTEERKEKGQRKSKCWYS